MGWKCLHRGYWRLLSLLKIKPSLWEAVCRHQNNGRRARTSVLKQRCAMTAFRYSNFYFWASVTKVWKQCAECNGIYSPYTEAFHFINGYFWVLKELPGDPTLESLNWRCLSSELLRQQAVSLRWGDDAYALLWYDSAGKFLLRFLRHFLKYFLMGVSKVNTVCATFYFILSNKSTLHHAEARLAKREWRLNGKWVSDNPLILPRAFQDKRDFS